MTFLTLLAFVIASTVIILVPGPTTTVIVANSMRDGPRAGFLDIAGTQFGLAVMILVVAFGLEAVVHFMTDWFVVIKLLGAAYLIWIGIMLWRSDGSLGDGNVRPPKMGYFWQGVVVIWSNPKALVLLGAFIPQFVQSSGSAFWQTIVLGVIFMVISTITDAIYTLLAARAGRFLTKGRVRLMERVGGSLLIGGGLWMAALRKA